MKNKLLLIPCLVFSQCIPEQESCEKSFVKLKKEKTNNSTIFSCSIQPIEYDTDLSHYKIFGIALRGDIECGKLKVAFKKQGNRLNYTFPLNVEEAISLEKIYMTEREKEKFRKGKRCSFRILFDDSKNISRFKLNDGVLKKCEEENIMEFNTEKIKISIFVEHKNTVGIDKASTEIVF